MSDTAAMTSMLTLVHSATTLLYVVADVFAVVVIATVVRRHRPDAYGNLLAWAIATLVLAIVVPLCFTLGAAFAGRDGIESMLRFQAIMTVVSAVFHLGVFALLLRGLVKLAQPPKPVTTEPVGPYR